MAVQLADMAPEARDLLGRSVAWMDHYWDAERGLLWGMGEIADWDGSTHETYHIVRESVWYALGLLVRDQPGDAGRAVQALEAILACQFDEPGKVYHGTFYRAPEEPHPPEPAIVWKHYDPNWREFIITAISVILSEYEEMLQRPLVEMIDIAIRKAVEGTLARGLTARYTNIALMQAQMLVYAGDRFSESGWIDAGEEMGREVRRLFDLHDAFEEYNSPTYYGTDIYALGLWQAYCPSPLLQRWGAEMEEALWRDIAQFYHAGLKNVAGPYDRSYGMDMRRYVALLGEYIWLVTGRELAPFPDLNVPLGHAGDFCFGPMVAVRPPRVPADAAVHFRTFLGERCVEHLLVGDPLRKATAWLAERVMIGAEATSLRDIGQGQFHPATIHWRVSRKAHPERGGAEPRDVGSVRLVATRPVDAVAGPHRLAVTSLGTVSFLIACPGVSQSDGNPEASVTPDRWRLPGLEVRVQASAPGTVEDLGEGQIVVRYGLEKWAGEKEKRKGMAAAEPPKEEGKTEIVLDLDDR